jgi:hypothetical protein
LTPKYAPGGSDGLAPNTVTVLAARLADLGEPRRSGTAPDRCGSQQPSSPMGTGRRVRRIGPSRTSIHSGRRRRGSRTGRQRGREPGASIGHLIAVKLLARDDRTRPQDLADLNALMAVATPADLEIVRQDTTSFAATLSRLSMASHRSLLLERSVAAAADGRCRRAEVNLATV